MRLRDVAELAGHGVQTRAGDALARLDDAKLPHGEASRRARQPHDYGAQQGHGA